MRIAIAGAGNVGRAIARELLDNGHQVLLIDKDPKALKLESVPDAEWLMADACEITSLDNAHLNNCQVLVAATGDDKANLVTSLLGKTEYGVPRVVKQTLSNSHCQTDLHVLEKLLKRLNYLKMLQLQRSFEMAE